MREIKFRAWDKKYGMMDSDFYIHSSGSQYDLASSNYNTPHIEIEKAELELMQYTGLKDKNGVEIYEGDLVQVEELFPNEPFKVWFRNGLFHIGNWHAQGFMNAFDEYCVVGNIYENPELLETKKD